MSDGDDKLGAKAGGEHDDERGTDEARRALAEQQSALARRLVAGGQTPAGFDEQRVAAAADVLAQKKRKVAERTARLRRERPGFFSRLWRWLRGR